MELKIKIKKDGCLFLFGVIYIKSFIFFKLSKKKKILKIQLNFQIRPKLKFVTIIILNQ